MKRMLVSTSLKMTPGGTFKSVLFEGKALADDESSSSSNFPLFDPIAHPQLWACTELSTVNYCVYSFMDPTPEASTHVQLASLQREK